MGDILVATVSLFCLSSTWEGALNTRTFWGVKGNKQMSATKYCVFSFKSMCEPQRLSMFHLKSACVMAWDESFSKIRVTGRCKGWFGAISMCWQCVRRVETSPPSHITWRFLSDLTIAWMWCASENWTSIESCETEKVTLVGVLLCIGVYSHLTRLLCTVPKHDCASFLVFC